MKEDIVIPVRDAPIVGHQYTVQNCNSGYIRCTKVENNTFFFIRCHSFFNGEQIKLRQDEWNRCHWVPVNGQYQLI